MTQQTLHSLPRSSLSSVENLQVNWRFLQHQNLKVPKPSRLPFVNLKSFDQNVSKHSEKSSTINDLTGETQRQVMLDRILVDMEDLAFQDESKDQLKQEIQTSEIVHKDPTTFRLNEPSIQIREKEETTLDADEKSFENSLKRVQDHEKSKILWQKTTGAKVATDIPHQLLTLSLSDDSRRTRSLNKLQATQLEEISFRLPQKRLKSNVRTTFERPNASPRKVKYGVWYVPQSKWWTLHKTARQHLATHLPTSNLNPQNDLHCIRRNNCTHKPQLPKAALSHHQTVRPSMKKCNRLISSTSHMNGYYSSAPLEMQAIGIAQSYIGREYRAYIVSTATTMPSYLK
ncbi:uncharacterized protein PHALS_12186 [Plasmopara halstedii]|uniref:Uncharacterized protein n=1 Tax=Plasmopara halstedii TaxID=4781 RepID=A0A0P1AM78_PLAHL|nr:uncharacterized protein PHALS_12186 [Plasmopara halstedii]CEG41871.1 hypothetical protein PHALS_12186 [Plasmopara halstedii]|eukprot:XP_024578240.1 hypothetical protein PHALS_12186 [Plasmopara halstedii]